MGVGSPLNLVQTTIVETSNLVGYADLDSVIEYDKDYKQPFRLCAYLTTIRCQLIRPISPKDSVASLEISECSLLEPRSGNPIAQKIGSHLSNRHKTTSYDVTIGTTSSKSVFEMGLSRDF